METEISWGDTEQIARKRLHLHWFVPKTLQFRTSFNRDYTAIFLILIVTWNFSNKPTYTIGAQLLSHPWIFKRRIT